jgi:hypothetical protein
MTRWCSYVLATASAACLAAPAHAQTIEGGKGGPRSTIDRTLEIELALSAAPPAVSDSAAVFVWTDGDFEQARAGSNGVTCYVARSWPDSLEPHCFDEEGSRTILPVHMRQMEMWHEGRDAAEIDAEIAEGLRSGRFRLPTRPAMSYMMSAGQRLVSDDGRAVGAWEPHLMIYYPWLTPDDLGLGPIPSLGTAIVVDPGTPFSNIMIVLGEHVPVRSVQLPSS